MTPNPEQTTSSPGLEMAARPFNSEDVFWLKPSAIQAVDNLINITHLSTMSLGVETHAADNKVAREQMAKILIPDNDDLSADLQRALDIGFMYGGLIAHQSQDAKPDDQEASVEAVAETYSRPLPASIVAGLHDAQNGLELETANDNYLFFRKLRALEVHEGGSDILAFCLAATQDHIGAEFNDHRKPDAPLTMLQRRRLQSLYYAGALVGALIAGDEESRNKPQVEIMRGAYAVKEPISVRMEFEPGDDIASTLEYLLGSKLTFGYVDNGYNEPYVAVLPSGIQFGPNALSLPIHIPNLEEPEIIYKAPLRDIRALIVTYSKPDSDATEKFGIVTQVAEYFSNPDENTKVAGLLLPDSCISSYHQIHPNASVIHDLASQASRIPVSELGYSCELVPAARSDRWSTNQKLGAYAAVSVASIWATEALEYALIKDTAINWEQDISLSAIVLAAVGILAYAKRTIRNVGREHDEDYQKLLDQFTLPQ